MKLLKKQVKFSLPSILKEELGKYSFVFNPSFVFGDLQSYWAFRCFDEKNKAIICLIFILNRKDEIEKKIDLNDVFEAKFGCRPADPKLFSLGGEVFFTINTGYSQQEYNRVFLCNWNNGELVIRDCHIDSKRSVVEKNWMFFLLKNEMYLLYSISPQLKLFKLKSISQSKAFFSVVLSKTVSNRNLSIGTPLIEFGNQLRLIAHEKFKIGKKRMYLGVPVTINLLSNDVKISKEYFFHSLSSLLGDKHKFNKNLLSCSYFSGLQKIGEDKTMVSYGINDHHMNFVILNDKNLWP